MELKSIKKKFNGVLTLVLTIAALTVGQNVWAASTFTVTNTSGTSKFVITRTSNTSATETVNYRTVSLSAIAGQHFTDKTGTLTFDAIHNSREVEVTENTPGTDAYKYQNGTSRKYRFEVLDQGGFCLASTDRTITTGTSVPSSNAFAVKDVIIQTNEYTADDKGYDKNGYKSVSSSSFFTSSNAPKNYLKHIGAQLLMTLSFQGKENDDAYEYLQLLFNETTNCDGRSGKSNGDPGDPNLSSYMAGFEMNTGTKDDTYRSYTFPILDVESGGKANDPWGYDPTNHKWPLKKQNFKSGSRATDGRIIVPMDFSSIVLRLNSSGGSGSDEWAVKNVKAHIQAVDGTAPSRLGDPVVSGSMHAKGNTFYVSVPFDEIVTVTGTPTLSTTWGSASYVSSNGGSGSNVLTFSGTITASAGKALTVNSISGTIKDLAGNELSSAGKAINKNIGTTVDANHTFTITYDLADGTVATANPDNYTYETATFTLNNPIHTGYTFAGWTGSNGNTPQTTVTIPAGSHGDKAYTANWTPLWGQDDGKTGEDKDHAYVISSTDGLDMLAKVVNGTDGYTANTFEGKFFKLGADITYTHISEWNNANSTENNYTAIGRLSVNKYYTFMGTFDGDGYTVSGIRIYKNSNTDACNYQGLFGLIGQQGIVRNITLDDSRITGNIWSGGIAGNSVGTVDNCHVTDQVLIHTLSTGNKHGGIAGRNSGLLQNSTSAATLSANSVNAKEYGGIAGYNLGTVQNCLAVGTSISSQNQYVGAIVGVNDGGTLVSNYYRNCTVGSTANAINVGVGGESSSTDQAGARSVHTLTLVDGVTASGESVIIGSYTYYASNTTVTLGYSQAVAQQITYHYNDGSDHDITGHSFSMPASDASVSGTFTDIWSGSGTSGKPYLITTPYQLDFLAKQVNGTDGYTANDFEGRFFKLGNGIAYSSTDENYTAIGSASTPFKGTFDGNGMIVSGIRINQGTDDYQGLFGYVGTGGTVKNVILTETTITGYENTGAIAGYNEGTLSANYYRGCTVNGTVDATNVGVGSESGNSTPHDIAGARSIHALTLPTGVTATGESVTIGTDTYYASNTTVTLNAPAGYAISSASYNDGDEHDITDNTFTMPAADVTVTADYIMTWASLKSAMQNGGTFTLPYDITATETDTYLYVPSGKTVTLDLNGHTINRNLTAAANNGYVIGINGTLTINDSSDPNTGSITGGNSTDKCGGVYVSGTFTMNGGTVTGNTGTSGGGVYVQHGTFNMSGGTISNNSGSWGGGVYVQSTFNMSGGTISNNSGSWGGGVYVQSTFNMSGGTISNNSGSLGGGVYVQTDQTINISGNPVITGNTLSNTTTANNVYLESGMVITVTDALTTGASIGVSMQNNTGVFTSGLNGNGTVANFTCDNSSECGVYLNGNGEASIIVDVWGIPDGADGTSEATAYTITTTRDLDLLAKKVNGIDGYTADKFDGKFFKLGNDITYAHTTDWNDVTSTENNYISIGFQYDKEFWGTFDGDGHTISGIRIYKGNDDCQGLFGYARGTVKNVTLSDARITGCNNVGGIVGFLTNYTDQLIGTVNNCHVDGNVAIHTVVSNADYHGGIVGNSGTVINCTSQAVLTVADNLTGCDRYGGIVGQNDGNVSNCTSSATIIVGNGVSSSHFGGIVGQNRGSVSSCLAIGATFSNVIKKGAIVGFNDTNSNGATLNANYYHDCTMNGTVNATNVGTGNGDQSGARSVHTLTLADGITATGESVEISGVTYYASNTTITLNCTPPVGYAVSEYIVDGTAITGNTFTMPAADVTVTADYIMTWASLKSAMQNGGTFTLPYDITATETDTYLYVPSGKTVTLDLNGHTINRNLTAAANNGYVIKVDGTLIINDSSDPNTGSITGGYNNYTGGGVYVSGSFTMNGGIISNNTATYAASGSGVYVGGNNGVFNMNGGTICNNKGNNGGGVFVGSSGNNRGVFTMTGGTISGNTGSSGGGVYSLGTFNISGNPVITGNTNGTTSKANNVFVKSGMVITVTDALTTGASIGVRMQDNTGVFTSGLNGNGTVANFTCDNSSECGVYLNGNGEASIIVDVWGIPDGADGTSEATAYTITTTRDLDLLAKKVNGIDGYTADKFDGKFFKLGNDITYAHKEANEEGADTENNYTAIGTSLNYHFRGTFDGKGHTVSGIRIYKGADNESSNNQGLFGYVKGGTVKNITLSDARITGRDYVGGIVGYLTNYTDQLIGTVNNCHVDGNVAIHTVVSNADHHGGIVGYNNGNVSNCISSATIIVGNGVTNCRNYGGIVGYNIGSVSSCLAIGATIPNVGYYKGAIAGWHGSGSLATNYYYNCTIGDVSNTTSVGVDNRDINDNNNPEGAVAATILSELETVPGNLDGKVAFRREFTGGKASTICLPFALTDIEGGKAYEFVDVTYDAVDGWVATMNEVTATVANKPYLFLPEGSGSVPVLFHGTAGYDVSGGLATTSGDWTFTGTYTNLTYGSEPMTGHIYGFASKSKTVDGHDVEAGQFVHAKDGASVPPMRCYLTYKNGAQRAPMRASALGATGTDTDVPSRITVRLVSAGGTVTVVGTLDTVTGEMDINTWYDMNGRLLETEPTAPGLYIHNGKTIMIKK